MPREFFLMGHNNGWANPRMVDRPTHGFRHGGSAHGIL